jgi:hypothetical protein
MEIKPFKEYKQIGNLMHGLFLLILLPAIYLLWKNYSESGDVSWAGILLVIIYLTVQFIYENFYRTSNVHCRKCKSKCFPTYEQMEDDKETWVQLKFLCRKCGIIWDTEDRMNINDKRTA